MSKLTQQQKEFFSQLVNNFTDDFEKYCINNKFSCAEYYDSLCATIIAAAKTITENGELYVLSYRTPNSGD